MGAGDKTTNTVSPSTDDDEKKQTASSRRSAPTPTPSFLNKFATMAADKYCHNLRRDLLLSNFDRNLTVEQAHFDPNASLAVPQDNNDNHHLDSYYNTAPYLEYGTGHSPPLGNLLTPPAEINHHLVRRTSNNKLETKRKQPKRSPMPSAATPSEYFHRNLLDAVSNVDDSDENEYYVYPYSGSEHNGNTSDHSTSRSLRPKKSNTGLLRTSISSLDLGESVRRPKLRSYVMDPHFTRKEYGSFKPSSKRNQQARYYYQDGYISDDESESLLWNVHPRQIKKDRQRCLPLWLICGLVTLIFMLCFLALIRAKPLDNVTLRMGRVLASDKELIFDLHVTAYNPNGWTVLVADADISLFAFSRIVPAAQTTNLSGADPAEYLASVYHFDEPLAFSSSFLSSAPSQAVTQIRIKSPGDDQGGNGRWSRMIRYPYGLLARGVLSYHSLPGLHSQSVAICNEAQVDPDTGVVLNDPDQGYCAIENQ